MPVWSPLSIMCSKSETETSMLSPLFSFAESTGGLVISPAGPGTAILIECRNCKS